MTVRFHNVYFDSKTQLSLFPLKTQLTQIIQTPKKTQ